MPKASFEVAPLVGGEKVVTRIAPSPTGNLHVGTARAALFNFLFARHHRGTFILRSEDTDRERSKKEFEDDIFEGLKWLGLTHDAFYRQSERTELYRNYLERLIKQGAAYVSHEQNEKEPTKGSDVVRLKNPGKAVVFNDSIHGTISFDTTELGDFIIARSIDDPLYHFAVVVDDWEMGVTHVIRGEDHISNTPRQILIQEAFGIAPPVYAHIPLILAPDRSKLSKRHGAVSVREYRDRGYLPEAFVNYLALLGWNPGGEQEFFTMQELIDRFDLQKVHKSAAIFDVEKLTWMNREYIRRAPKESLQITISTALPQEIKKLPQFSESRLSALFSTLLERITVLGDVTTLAQEGELSFYFEPPSIVPLELLWKNDADLSIAKRHLDYTIVVLEKISEQDFTALHIREALFGYATKEGRGSVLWPMRYALSGKEKSPDPFTLAEIFGKKETLNRLRTASATIE